MDGKRGKIARPLGVTLLAFLQLLTGLSNVILGLALLGASSSVEIAPEKRNIVFLLGVVFFLLGVSSLWLARGYIIGYEWARHRGRTVAVLSIILCVLVILLVLPKKLGPDNPVFSIIWNLIVFVYLGRPKIVSYFAGKWTGQTWSGHPNARRK